VVPSETPSTFELFDGSTVSQGGGQLASTKGSRFTTAVVWELYRDRPQTVARSGVAVPEVSDVAAVPTGFAWSGGWLRIKVPMGETVLVR